MLRKFKINKFGNLKLLSLSLLTVTFVLIANQEVWAADVSTDIEAGATTIDDTDTFIIDGTNDGVAGSNLTFSGANARQLTVSSDGTDGDDIGNLGAINVADNNDTSTLIVNDASNGDGLVVIVNGAVTGDVATAANDLDITIAANATNDTGDTTLEFKGNLDIGAGVIVLTGDVDDTSILKFSGAGNQAVTGAILSTTNDVGSKIIIANGANTVTFSTAIGASSGNGVESLVVEAGTRGNATFSSTVNANTADIDADAGASVMDFNGNVEAVSYTHLTLPTNREV